MHQAAHRHRGHTSGPRHDREYQERKRHSHAYKIPVRWRSHASDHNRIVAPGATVTLITINPVFVHVFAADQAGYSAYR
jgi:hypothetical protein